MSDEPAKPEEPEEAPAPAAKTLGGGEPDAGPEEAPAPAAKTLGGEAEDAPEAEEPVEKALGDPAAEVAAKDDDLRDAAARTGEVHQDLYALKEAERLLVPEHLDLPDHALLLTQEERDRAIAAVERGESPGDLRALIAARKAPPAPAAGDAPPVREPELPEPTPGTRAIGAVYVVLGLLGAWWLGSAAFGEGMDLAVENWRLKTLLRLIALALPLYPALLGAFAVATGREPGERTLLEVTGLRAPINPLGLPFHPRWWGLLNAIYLRELKATYTRPVAYFALFGFFFVSGLLFVALLEYYGGSDTLGQDFSRPASYFVTANWQLYLAMAFLCPAITMRLVAEERSAGSLENLLTTEVSHVQVTLGKYLGALSFFGGLMLANLVYMVVLRRYAGEWDWGPVLSAYLGLFLMGGLFLAIGLCTSAWASSQVVAFVVAMPLILLLLLNGTLLNMAPGDSVEALVRHTNVTGLQQLFAKGVLELKAVVFYATSIWFFVFVAVRGVASHRWQ
ncbi:MAG: ABC transporter permease [Planctomycetota bacterium]